MLAVMELGNVGFWGTVLIGILAGWLAHQIMGGRGGIIWNLIIGLVGSWIGFFVAEKLDAGSSAISSFLQPVQSCCSSSCACCAGAKAGW